MIFGSVVLHIKGSRLLETPLNVFGNRSLETTEQGQGLVAYVADVGEGIEHGVGT